MSNSSDGAISLVVTLAFLGLVLCGSACWSYTSCDQKGEVTGRETEWRLISGCYIKVEGRWIPEDSWRGEQDLNRSGVTQ